MSISLFIEQLLNGIQFGVMLFLMAAGLTLVLGIMNLVNLAHGSIYMAGAYFAATMLLVVPSFPLALLAALVATALFGWLLDRVVLKYFYGRSHLEQVLVTFGLIFVLNDTVRLIWGPAAINLPLPAAIAGSIEILPGIHYPAFRLLVLGAGLLVVGALYLLIAHTRAGMWVRAGASDRSMAMALGVDVPRVFTVVFGVGAALAGFAGMMTAPLTAVQVGMGEPILILALVVTVLGGIGSVRGAFIAALLVGLVDTFGRVLLPAAIGSIGISLLRAIILAFRPAGLFPARA
ncbi:MAG: branched-chain amino acid ABC transporter permease [Burkholderiales bacterium]|nr:branched-chain amino acid ABC transporter permease [Burkholderiales bacterium]